ncbi:hypothetical protein Dtox_2225 [Desulfofarcimen acetoxidans DSM 771]|uniref:Uncharacterized protein n=1 Tax=Desulfofarcimen acetoxidans (strain ATCC 49208 / DSM 771 / KCTC 5769 / VKM B-1644 / 5575) TaxID=485916 RepID=C8VZR4_DESAS|nr:DUF5986 family protein [Desulfofarcimen acetoxidans]ACV63042.1 hypothetical protein Dtox_2225 [Desulfofarcimen acetoxidans DSM 771]
MGELLISDKIPENFCRYIVNCINVALKDDYKRYMQEFHPDTTNGVPKCVHDWINSNLVKYLPPEYRMFKFNRYSWKSNMVVDDKNKIAYTIMRQTGLKRVKNKNKNRTSPHYLQTFVTILNAEFEARYKQLAFTEFYTEIYDQDTFLNDFNSLCGENLKAAQGYRHCLIAFHTQAGQLSDVKAWVLDKDLDVYDEMCLNDYIKPDYSKLTEVVSLTEHSELPQANSNEGLLKFTDKSLVKLKQTSKEL